MLVAGVRSKSPILHDSSPITFKRDVEKITLDNTGYKFAWCVFVVLQTTRMPGFFGSVPLVTQVCVHPPTLPVVGADKETGEA